MSTDNGFDFDQVVIGSGFGGAVSALRLSEKGHRVLVLEKGLRREDRDYPQVNTELDKFMWEPKLGLHGTTQLSLTSKVNVLHGIGVGGGSQIYAAVNLVPDDSVFESPSWRRIRGDWKTRLAPYYALAQRMLGSCTNPVSDETDEAVKQVAAEMGRGETFDKVTSGILFAQPGQEPGTAVDDPYFAGDGPARNACEKCGSCIIGCRYNAKNSLMKNYLYFAERNGVEIRAESEVIRIEPLTDSKGNEDGSAGYQLTVRHALKKKQWADYTLRTRGVVVSAGVLGTVPLLMKMRDEAKTLPRISNWLGQQVRTNSETLISVSDMDREVWRGTTISSMATVDDTTTMEVNRFRKGSDATWKLSPYVPMVTGEGFTRILKWLGNTMLHPLKTLKVLKSKGKGGRSIVFLVMQTSEAYVHMEWRRRWYRLFRKGITAVQKPGDEKLTVSFPAAEQASKRFAEKLGGEAGTALLEILTGTPMTAHIISGVPMGTSADNGVIDETGEVFGYHNLRVIDGSVIPGNLGVNPSLTITALSEYAMSRLPVFDQEHAAQIKPVRFSSPLPDQVSPIDGEGDLLAQIINVGQPVDSGEQHQGEPTKVS